MIDQTQQNRTDYSSRQSNINYKKYDHCARQLRSNFFWSLFARWTSKRVPSETQTAEADVCLCH